jgi:hypothetical protein
MNEHFNQDILLRAGEPLLYPPDAGINDILIDIKA